MICFGKIASLCLVAWVGFLACPFDALPQLPLSAQNNGEKVDGTIPRSPQIQASPQRLDFGVVPAGQKLSRRIAIANGGKEPLRWRGSIIREVTAARKAFRYFSLINDEIRNTGAYRASAAYHDIVELSGGWPESEGAPVLVPRSVLKFHFTGTGVRVSFWREPAAGRYSVYLDQTHVTDVDVQANQRERVDIAIGENMPDAPHTLTLVGKDGKIVLDGFLVYGKSWSKGPPGWLTLVPNGGITTREIDYVAVTANTQKLSPGYYGEVIRFASNGGEVQIPVNIEISANGAQRVLNIYRYSAGRDYLFTANPQADEYTISTGLYKSEGVAFRLFPAGTPGTVEFYRWYSPSKRNHFYSYNKYEAAKNGADYTLEGSLGQIATTRLKSTRELYRWFNPKTGFYFYSTDLRGDGAQRKGYRFDGIAGYVR